MTRPTGTGMRCAMGSGMGMRVIRHDNERRRIEAERAKAAARKAETERFKQREREWREAALKEIESGRKAVSYDRGHEQEEQRTEVIGMTIFDHEDLGNQVFNGFIDKARKSANVTAACRAAVKDMSADDIADAYASGKDLNTAIEEMNEKRKDEQLRFKPIYEEALEKTTAYLDDAFSLKPDEYSQIAPILEGIKLTGGEMQALLKANSGSWTKMRAIVDAGNRAGLISGKQGREAMMEYEATVREKSLGVLESARKGVLMRDNKNWEASVDKKRGDVDKARTVLHSRLGIAETVVTDPVLTALRDAAWTQ